MKAHDAAAPWCKHHDNYWTHRRWSGKPQPEKVARLKALSQEELKAYCDDLLSRPMPVPGLYRLLLHMRRHEEA